MTAAASLLSMTGCIDDDIRSLIGSRSSESDEASDSDSGSSDISESSFDSAGNVTDYEKVELDDVREHVEQILADAEISGNREALIADIDVLMNDADKASEALAYANISYYSDWNNEALEDEYDSCYETFYVTSEMLLYAFSNCYKYDEYSDLFKDYIYEDYLDYYTDRSMSLKRLEGYSKVDCEVMDEYLDAYYDILYSEDMDDDEMSLKAAEVYLDVLAGYQTDSFYDAYNRDFTPEDVLSLKDTVLSEMNDASDALLTAFWSIEEANDVLYDPVQFDNPFETIAEYGGKISAEIGESAQYLLDNERYTLTDGDNCYTGSFTTDLPLENDALIYVYNSDDYYNLLTPVHEFGHFYSSFYDDTPTYLMENNIDIAEIQSQGMEMLFWNLYDEIYGEQAEAMRIVKVFDMIDSVSSGFAVGEFEYTVLENLDDMTPEKVVSTFDEIMGKYGYELYLYEIPHIFEQPGYYISYGVSALAALDIWVAALDDYDEAVEMYNKISRIPINSGEYQFNSALEECGFADVLDEKYIEILADKIENYAKSAG
jgi:hypothetical protein